MPGRLAREPVGPLGIGREEVTQVRSLHRPGVCLERPPGR